MRAYLCWKSGANRDASPRYRDAYAAWVPTRPWAARWSDEKYESFRSACYWLIDNLDAVQAWRRRLHDRLALPAGEPLAHRLDHLPLAGDDLERLGDVLAELRQLR
jgi:hypothetical protein